MYAARCSRCSCLLQYYRKSKRKHKGKEIQMGNIIVAGSINMDIVTKLECLPRPGETVFGNELHYIPGGKGSNQAVAASRLGNHVHLDAARTGGYARWQELAEKRSICALGNSASQVETLFPQREVVEDKNSLFTLV